jgi:hypothetical protein
MSIFELKSSTDELQSLNSGISSLKYHQTSPSRDVTLDNFSNGQISNSQGQAVHVGTRPSPLPLPR